MGPPNRCVGGSIPSLATRGHGCLEVGGANPPPQLEIAIPDPRLEEHARQAIRKTR